MAVPRRYNDPEYGQLARSVESRLGLPRGILDAIRLQGERSNADQVSPMGARTVYQFIPSTRRGMMRVHGVDPWSGPEQATTAAGYHLLDDYNRTHSWDTAIARYHGGPDPNRWGPRTRAYINRVGSFDRNQPEDTGETEVSADMPQIDYMTGETVVQNAEPPKLVAPTDGVGPSKPVAASAEPQVRQRRGGILGALSRIFMPEPDSLWAGALRGGLVNARESQQQYRQGQATATRTAQMGELERQQAEMALKQLITHGRYQIAGNNLVHTRPDGTTEVIAAPTTPSETERLIDRWRRTPPGPERDLIERAIRGFQYTDPVIQAQGEARERVARARPRAPTAYEQRRYEPPTGFVRR